MSLPLQLLGWLMEAIDRSVDIAVVVLEYHDSYDKPDTESPTMFLP
tara:strand:+ start:362 stop:499 length:138 start_codon:yes stop_codon:yes gene_type:complete